MKLMHTGLMQCRATVTLSQLQYTSSNLQRSIENTSHERVSRIFITQGATDRRTDKHHANVLYTYRYGRGRREKHISVTQIRITQKYLMELKKVVDVGLVTYRDAMNEL